MSKIEWTDETWNFATGCKKVSPGCDNCYMFQMYPRLKAMGVPGYQAAPDRVTVIPERLQLPYTWRKPRRVFVNSMSDFFHPDIPDAIRLEAFDVMAANPRHTFQILTKRPRTALHWTRNRFWRHNRPRVWPLNIWIGTSVESEAHLDRVPLLMQIPARTRFISAEPLLGPLLPLRGLLSTGLIHWVIVGGESGPKARPMDPAWAMWIKDDCWEFKIAYFLKQLGGYPDKRGGEKAVLDGRMWHQTPGDRWAEIIDRDNLV